MHNARVRIEGRVYEFVEYHRESEIGWHFTLRCIETGKRSQWCFPKTKMVGDSLVYLMPPKALELSKKREEEARSEMPEAGENGTETYWEAKFI